MISIGIADDDALVRQTLTDLLSRNDDIVVAWTAKDGQEALDLFRSSEVESRVQAVLVDVQMPKMDGLALAQALLEEKPDIAILILTTFTADSIVDEAMALGVRGFVAKEDGASSLAGAIHQAVGKRLRPTLGVRPGSDSRAAAPFSSPPRGHPLRTRTGGADTCRRRQDQQADCHSIESQRGHGQDSRIRHHCQARSPRPGGSSGVRPAAQPGVIGLIRSAYPVGRFTLSLNTRDLVRHQHRSRKGRTMFHFFPFSLNLTSFSKDFDWRNFRNWG